MTVFTKLNHEVFSRFFCKKMHCVIMICYMVVYRVFFSKKLRLSVDISLIFQMAHIPVAGTRVHDWEQNNQLLKMLNSIIGRPTHS